MPKFADEITGAALAPKDFVVASSTVMDGWPTLAVPDVKKKQADAWKAYDAVGEVHYIGSSLVGASIETLSWYGAIENEASPYNFAAPVEMQLSEKDAKVVHRLVASISPNWGTQRDFMRALGVNLFMVGEGYHVTKRAKGEWEHEFVPASHIVDQKKAANGRVVVKYRDPITGADVNAGDGRNVTRVWRAHPNDPSRADSPMLAVSDLLEELTWIQRLTSSALRQRLMTSGLLVVTNSILGPDFDPNNQDAIAGAVNKVEASLIQQLSRNIDPDSDVPALPIIMFAPFEHVKDGFNYVEFGERLTEVVQKERDAALQRLAKSLDIPTEFVTGIGEVNHWSAWLIRDLLWSQHLQPLATLMADAITTSFLRPALRVEQERGTFDADPDIVKLWFKVAALQSHPDLWDYLSEAFDKGIIGKEPILQALGIPADVAITDEEFELWLELKRNPSGQTPEGQVRPDNTTQQPFPSRQRGQRTSEGPANRSRSGEDGPSQR